jgi:dihydrofolate reductase
MGQLVVDMFVTLDGVLQAPGEPDEDRDGGFDHGGWQAPYFDDESGAVIGEHLSRLDALLLGRRTYDIFAAYWPKAPDENPIAPLLNDAPKYVASRTLGQDDVGWAHTTVLEGDLADAVGRVKGAHEEIHVIGSGDLVQSLLAAELVDRINLWLYPIVLGTGKRLFPEGATPAAFRLAGSATFPSGAVLLVYDRAGKPAYGNLAWDADGNPLV